MKNSKILLSLIISATFIISSCSKSEVQHKELDKLKIEASKKKPQPVKPKREDIGAPKPCSGCMVNTYPS